MIVLFASLFSLVSLADVASASEKSKRICAKRLNDKDVQKGFYAFALSADRAHCGWSWNKDSIKHAEYSSLKSCRKFKGADCKIIHSGCNPTRTNKCNR
ncbi:DUF4189 domain-containing protein [Cohaesibacter celericrescens]